MQQRIMHMCLCALLYLFTCSLWSPRNCIPVIDLLDEWIPLFSDWIVTNILDQLIMPKLHVSYNVFTCTIMIVVTCAQGISLICSHICPNVHTECN